MQLCTMSTINDLPTEIMLEVGEYLILVDPHHVLLSFLSQTCRRFHDIFTPFMAPYHVRSILESSIHKFITTANGQPDTPSTFSLDGNFEEMSFKLKDRTINDIRCFRNLIFRANAISRITVDVGRREITRCALACLLNSCVQRPDLHLRVEEDRGISWSSRDLERGPFIFNLTKSNSTESTPQEPQETQPVKTTWKDVLLGALNALSSRLPFKSSKEVSLPQIPSTCDGIEVIPRNPRFEVPRPKVAPRLTGLWIEGDCLFSASNYPWTMDIMNAAPLTHLSITKSKLTMFDWSQILPSITISTLAYLAISVSVAFPDLLDFFHRHPSLQEINLSDNEPIGVVSFLISTPSSRSNLLPKLKTLVATPDYIYPFMCHQQDGYFHNLNAYDIRPFPLSYESCFRNNRFRAILELLSTKGLRSRISLTLSTAYLNLMIEWSLDTSKHRTDVGCRKLPRIWKIVLTGEPLSTESIRTLLEQQEYFAFIYEASGESLLDRHFHTICPNLQLIEYKECGYNDWSMIV